jgi:hypothetical protein
MSLLPAHCQQTSLVQPLTFNFVRRIISKERRGKGGADSCAELPHPPQIKKELCAQQSPHGIKASYTVKISAIESALLHLKAQFNAANSPDVNNEDRNYRYIRYRCQGNYLPSHARRK